MSCWRESAPQGRHPGHCQFRGRPSGGSTMSGPSISQMRQQFLKRYLGLFEDTVQRAGLKRLVLRDNNGDAVPAQDQMRTALTEGKKSQTLQGPCRLRPVDIARQFHATARMGSSTKCRRTWRGCSPGSKYPFTASATIACNSARVSPWVVIPPPWGSSHRATNPPVSEQDSTRNVISLIGVVCQPFGTEASRTIRGFFDPCAS